MASVKESTTLEEIMEIMDKRIKDKMTPTTEQISETEISYAVTLSNGSVLLIIEDVEKHTVSIGVGSGPIETHGHIAEVWICSMDASGVTVMPNSGSATADITYYKVNK